MHGDAPTRSPAGGGAGTRAAAGPDRQEGPCPDPHPRSAARPGGFYGWWLLFFLWVVYTIPIGFAFYSPAVLYPFMIQDLGWSRGQTMAGATGLMLSFGLASPLTALMISRLGARLTIVTGAVLTALACSLMAPLGHRYPAYVALSLAAGVGVSLGSMIPVQTVVIAWFHARRALALGLVLGGGAVGGFVAPQIINSVVRSAGGNWRSGWIVIAGAALAAGLVALLTLRNRPEELGQVPDGAAGEAGCGSRANRGRPHLTYRTPYAWTVREALRTRSLWLLALAVGGSFFLWQVIVTQGPLHLQDRGFEPSRAAFLYSLAIGLSVVGRFTIALLGDRIEPRNLFAFGTLCILSGGVLFWFVSPEALWAAYLYPLLAGFGFGVAYICIPTMLGNYWGPEAFAGLSGIVSPICNLIQASAAPLAGVLYDLRGSYFPAVVVAWAGAVVGFAAILFCKPPQPAARERPP